MRTQEVDVCIVGGGPAGMVAGYLLSKAGLRTLVLEQHANFEREYRGEVLMPRFTQMMRHLGLFEYLETFPHHKFKKLEGFYRDRPFIRIGIDEISPEAPFAVWMPQPVLLDALYQKSRQNPSFDLWFNARLKDTLDDPGGGCAGAVVEKDRETIEVRSKVLMGADGRFSVLRRLGKFELDHESHGFDLVWFTVPEPDGYNHEVRFYFSSGRNYLILPKYPKQLQIGVVIRPGEYSRYHRQGIDSLRKALLETRQPMIEKFAREVRDFQEFNVLQAKIEHVRRWAKDGMVLIGDAAHTCSPAGAIGVSVATETAMTAASVILECFRKKDFSARALGRIQELRDADVRGILRLQEQFTAMVFGNSGLARNLITPLMLFFITRLGLFRRFQRRLMVLQSALPDFDNNS